LSHYPIEIKVRKHPVSVYGKRLAEEWKENKERAKENGGKEFRKSLIWGG